MNDEKKLRSKLIQIQKHFLTKFDLLIQSRQNNLKVNRIAVNKLHAQMKTEQKQVQSAHTAQHTRLGWEGM